LTGGIIAVAVIAVLIFVILFYARVGALHGQKVTLYVVTEDAPGVLRGTEVWLAGQKEGLVKDVTFRAASVDTSERVLIILEFLKTALPSVRKDSYAQIRPGGSPIGTPIIYISPGTSPYPQLNDGDTLREKPKPAIANLANDIGSIGPELSALGAATSELATKLDRPVGTIGTFRAEGLPDLPDVKAGVSSLQRRATTGNGSLALATRGNLRARAMHTMSSVDSIRRLVSSNRGSLGRFRRDSSLVAKSKHVLAELDTLQALVTSPIGTLAAVHSDTVLASELHRNRILLNELILDMKKNPMRYIRF
jgi:phospholipid/cholesterol/gamma-HCH transport system substrate-binding protein